MSITATELLLSMVSYIRPSRAEVSDVANAILEGSEALMLSEETAIGKHPYLVVKAMVRIIKETEKRFVENKTITVNAKLVEPGFYTLRPFRAENKTFLSDRSYAGCSCCRDADDKFRQYPAGKDRIFRQQHGLAEDMLCG